MKDQQVKKMSSWLALAGLFVVVRSNAVSFQDVQFWIGTGTNQAALVVEWSVPESYGTSTVPAPVADQTLVWGYRFNGTATATAMLRAILDADPRLYVVADTTWGTYVEAIGYNQDGGGLIGLADGAVTNELTTNFLTSFTVAIDSSHSLNSNDLYWGGYYGPNWETWTELGDAGGFLSAPDCGSNPYWTADDPDAPWSGTHGQWELAQLGLDSLQLTNGSWIGFSVAAGELDYFNTPINGAFYAHKHAPNQPAPAITAVVKNFAGALQFGQWQVQFLSCSNWTYALERSTNMAVWSVVTGGVAGTGSNLSLTDGAPPADKAYYRIRAEHP